MIKYLIRLDKYGDYIMNYEKLAESIFKEINKDALCNNNCHSLPEVLSEFSRGEAGVLSYLSFDKEEATSGELSEKLNVTTARVAKILNSLENKGLIKRKEDIYDKRKTVVVITEKGTELAEYAKKNIINKITNVIKEIGYDEVISYLKTTKRIIEVINKEE